MPGLCEALKGWTVYRRVLTAHDLKECLRPDAWDPVEPGEPEGDSCYLGQTLPWDHAIWIASMGKTTALPHEYAHVLTWSTVGEATHCHWTACGINKMLKGLPGYSRDFNCWDD
jgi:hypothetical protein